MEESTKTFLEKLQELKEKKIKVDVLSTKKQIDASPLSFKQQKDLISTIADGSIGSLKFQKFINDIIIQNTGDSTLKVTDKLPIIVQLRVDSIGNKIKFGEDEVEISLDKILKLKPKNSKTLKGDISIELEVPTLSEENEIILATIQTLKKDGEQEVGKNVGSIYTYEIVKYVKTIKFGDQTLDFKEVSIRDRVKIVDNLPLSTNKEIISFIQEIKKLESEALVVQVDGQDKYFDIDVSFFDS
jgi:hypothetical protein